MLIRPTSNRETEIVLNQSACINIDTSFFAVFYPEIKISFPERIDKDYYIFSKALQTNYNWEPMILEKE